MRVPDDKQWVKNNSVPEQQGRIERYFQYKLAEQGVEWGGIECDDRAISASKRDFSLRLAGKRLMAVLRPGDHLIIDKLDRRWVQTAGLREPASVVQEPQHHVPHRVDGLRRLDRHERVRWRIAAARDNGLCGRGVAGQQRAAQAHYIAARKSGRAATKYPPPGCKHVKHREHGKWVKFIEWDAVLRGKMSEVVRLIDQKKTGRTTKSATTWSRTPRCATGALTLECVRSAVLDLQAGAELLPEREVLPGPGNHRRV